MGTADSILLVDVEVSGPRAIHLHVSLDDSPEYEAACVRDVESAMDRLEIWLRRIPGTRYDVVIRGADGTRHVEMSPNRYLALHFIANTLADVVRRGPAPSAQPQLASADSAE